MTNAYKYLIDAGGIEEEDSYPYTGKRGDCKFNPEKAAVKVVNFTNVPIDEKQIAAHLVHHGPLAGILPKITGFNSPLYSPFLVVLSPSYSSNSIYGLRCSSSSSICNLAVRFFFLTDGCTI